VFIPYRRGGGDRAPGYFAQQGQWPFVGMFAVLLAVALTSIVLLVRDEGPPERD